MRNVYELLNEVETDLNDYHIAPLTELEQKRLENKVKRISKKSKYSKRWLGAACAAVCSLGFLLMVPADSPVYAAKESAAYHIGQFL